MWDDLLEAVQNDQSFQLQGIGYYSSIYELFVHENLRKYTQVTSPYASYCVISSKLKNLVELDLTCAMFSDSSECALIGQECRKLQVLKLGGITVPDCYEALAGCTGLKSLSYKSIINGSYSEGVFVRSSEYIAAKLAVNLFPSLELYSSKSMGKVLLHLTTTKTLNLRSVTEHNCTAAIMNRIIELCPHLESLDACYDPLISPVLETLAMSSLEIRELTVAVAQFDENFKRFIEKKGRHLWILTVYSRPITKQALQLISKFCSNLTHLTLQCMSRINIPVENSVNTLTAPEKIFPSSLTKLEHLKYISRGPVIISDVELLKMILPRDSGLTKLEIRVWQDNINELLSELRKSVKMNRLEVLEVSSMASAALTGSVLKEIYVNLPRLKRLVFNCCIDQSFRSCMEKILREVHDNNLDFDALVVDYGL